MIRTSPVRFTADSIGLVAADDPFRFVPPVVREGDTGELLVEATDGDDFPFSVPDGWVIVRVDVPFEHPIFGRLDALYAPVHPSMIEVVR